MRKMYLSAPLPFVGQKRMFAKEFMKVLEQYPDGTLFVDLFGGSGLLSHCLLTCSVAPDCCLTLPNPSSPTLLLSIMTLITTASA